MRSRTHLPSPPPRGVDRGGGQRQGHHSTHRGPGWETYTEVKQGRNAPPRLSPLPPPLTVEAAPRPILPSGAGRWIRAPLLRTWAGKGWLLPHSTSPRSPPPPGHSPPGGRLPAEPHHSTPWGKLLLSLVSSSHPGPSRFTTIGRCISLQSGDNMVRWNQGGTAGLPWILKSAWHRGKGMHYFHYVTPPRRAGNLQVIPPRPYIGCSIMTPSTIEIPLAAAIGKSLASIIRLQGYTVLTPESARIPCSATDHRVARGQVTGWGRLIDP